MASSPAVDQDAKYFSGNTFKDSMRELLCGIVSGFVCKVVEYPFDTLKVIMQVGCAVLDTISAVRCRFDIAHRSLSGTPCDGSDQLV